MVTLSGEYRCPPTAVDAGLQDGLGVPRDPAAVSGIGVTLLVIGGLLVAARRRRRGAPGAVDA